MTLLTGEHGFRWMTQIKSALNLGLRPSAHVLRLKKPRSNWSDADHSVAEAYQRLDDETCPQCGHPVWICRSGNNMLDLTPQWDVCRVTKSIQGSKRDAKPGEFAYIIPKMRGNRPMVTREDYYDERAAEAAIHAKKKR